MASPWVKQTLARPILWITVKYTRKIATRMKIEAKVSIALFHLIVAIF